MLQNNWFEKGIHRIGAEQEMVLIDIQNYRPDPINIEVISKLEQYDWLDTELAMFNLETNFVPREFTGDCFSQMMEESTYQLKIIREALVPFNADLILTGILPTIRKSDLEDKFLTPKKRYLALMEAVRQQMTGDSFEFRFHPNSLPSFIMSVKLWPVLLWLSQLTHPSYLAEGSGTSPELQCSNRLWIPGALGLI